MARAVWDAESVWGSGAYGIVARGSSAGLALLGR
jgi:hypothetical protein